MESTQKPTLKTAYDVVVVGGGMVGAATAIGLAQAGFSVCVLEPNPVEWSAQQPIGLRVSALTRASENILRHLGVWSQILSARAHPFVGMKVWDAFSRAEIDFHAKQLAEPNLGHLVENDLVQSALWQAFSQTPNLTVNVKQITQLQLPKQTDEWACVTLDDQTELRTRLVIGADGARSKVRTLAQIGLQTKEYDQCAVVGIVRTEKSHQDYCWQRYTADGPFAFLALAQNYSSIAWYLPIDKQAWALSLDDQSFALALEQASGARLGAIVEVGERGAFPLIRQHANHYVKQGLALVGDAAHTIHPQAGQGVNLGLMDAAALVETLVQAQKRGRDISSLSVLRPYERWRRGDNALVQNGMDALSWLYQDLPLQNAVRQQCLPLANFLTPVKSWLGSQALYGRGELPKMARVDSL
ncbi:MAG: UbiH/UbiF/VisC/COQ6 family ubiquinone biosynthesis hydroxylase [Thiotrichales bacterium]|nr:UbiH/UbiF/VisC/COQ6 family ubiquinone biosynthesis hydroxylase [Thiotrichales bacterium]